MLRVSLKDNCAGNSGGPAFADLQQAKVAGVAFSKLSNADNVGYIIPYQIIKHFLQVWSFVPPCHQFGNCLALLVLTSFVAVLHTSYRLIVSLLRLLFLC